MVILVRQIRWIAVIVLLVAVGYFAHSHLDYWQLDERQDRTIILRP